jgi:hypothetical protein
MGLMERVIAYPNKTAQWRIQETQEMKSAIR